MDTLVEIKAVTNDSGIADRAMNDAFEVIKDVEDGMSARKSGSLLDGIGKNSVGKSMKVPDELFDIIEVCQEYSRLTNGAFDISVNPVTRLWQFDQVEKDIPKEEDIKNAIKFVGYTGIHLDKENGTIELDREGMSLDLGGAAKGYAVDKAVEKLKESGIVAGIVNAGGDLRVFGKKPDGVPWNIGIQDPENSEGVIATIQLMDMALVTSGDYERYIVFNGIKYHHIIDPKTGQPARGCKSVSIAYMEAFDADILSTAVFVMGPDEGMKLIESMPGVEGMIVDASGRIQVSSGLKDRLKLHRNAVP
ncbi:MAG: FAD:protein FMN transferase [bacterium]